MKVEFRPAAIPGAGLLVTPFLEDSRGSFNKPFSPAAVEAAGIDFTVAEVYWSASHVGVVRGMHLQVPPVPLTKIAFVTTGAVRDIILDLRRGSPTEGQWVELLLRPGSGAAVVPVGCAHGFEVIAGPATFCSIQSGPFDAATDAGVRWDSAGIAWHCARPVVSERDAALPALADFESPFEFADPS